MRYVSFLFLLIFDCVDFTGSVTMTSNRVLSCVTPLNHLRGEEKNRGHKTVSNRMRKWTYIGFNWG